MRKILFFVKIIALIAIVGSSIYYSKQIATYCESFSEYIVGSSDFKLQKIYVKNNQNISQEELARALDVKLGKSIYLLNLEAIKTRLEQISWIKSVTVARKLPDTLVVNLNQSGEV